MTAPTVGEGVVWMPSCRAMPASKQVRAIQALRLSFWVLLAAPLALPPCPPSHKVAEDHIPLVSLHTICPLFLAELSERQTSITIDSVARLFFIASYS